MVQEIHRTENQMSAKLKEILDDYKQEIISEKENQIYRDTEFKLSPTIKKGRKRKLV